MGIHGHEDGFNAQRMGLAEELSSFFAVRVHVELKEEGLVRAPCFDNAGEGIRCVA